MGPRLGRVEYVNVGSGAYQASGGFNGATLRTRGIPRQQQLGPQPQLASMGPRLGRVEYIPCS